MRLDFYMSNGTVISTPGVERYEVKSEGGGELVYIKLIYKPLAKEQMILPSLNLKRLDCIVKVRESWDEEE